jgi:DNA-binding LacI/PurR family transcriptional regulator
MFEAALQDSSITAWVAVNDVTASMALDFLRLRGLSVPADLSLISFDDSPRALAANITSYNFNVYAIGTAMLGFVLGQRPYADKAGVQGYIVDRRSTGPARKGWRILSEDRSFWASFAAGPGDQRAAKGIRIISQRRPW